MARPNRYPETANRLRSLMKTHNVRSDSELSRILGVGRATVGGWLKGQFRPSGEALKALAEEFSVSEAYLLALEESSAVDSSTVAIALAAALQAQENLAEVIRALEGQIQAGAVPAKQKSEDEDPISAPIRSPDKKPGRSVPATKKASRGGTYLQDSRFARIESDASVRREETI